MSVLGLEMEMENSKEKFIMMKDQRQKMIMRGKRTKRSRPSVVSSSSSSGCSSGGKGENDHVYFSIPSPTSSDQNSACTEEDEDMANCLILLAQSGGDNSVKQETEEVKAEKFGSSRKFTETATTTTAAKAGFYVYECKTCNRSFTSFQALGGHRASHKKPKAMVEEKKVVVPSNPEGQINEAERENVQFNKTGTSFSVHKSSQHNSIIKSKVHECSICGSEFSSGQALGGHMRRHRSIPTTNNNIIDRENEKPRNILQLDLNLPAPEDDHRDSKFPFIFTAPALVGCHY